MQNPANTSELRLVPKLPHHFGDDEPTGITSYENDNENENGNENGVIYNLNGQKVTHVQKGKVYFMNGKKYLAQ